MHKMYRKFGFFFIDFRRINSDTTTSNNDDSICDSISTISIESISGGHTISISQDLNTKVVVTGLVGSKNVNNEEYWCFDNLEVRSAN